MLLTQKLATRSDPGEIRADLEKAIAETRADLQKQLADTNHDIRKWMVTAMITQIALLAGIIAFLR